MIWFGFQEARVTLCLNILDYVLVLVASICIPLIELLHIFELPDWLSLPDKTSFTAQRRTFATYGFPVYGIVCFLSIHTNYASLFPSF
jgi:hypothetical protein